jgi:uncharacterized protein
VSDSSRRVADAAPLGLAAFGGTTFLLSFFLAGTDVLLRPVVFATALFFGGLVQLVAGIVEFRQGSTFGATAFSAYGGFWISYGVFAWFIRPTLPADDVNVADGLFALPWAIMTLYLVVATLRISGVLLALVSGAFVTLTLVTIGNFAESTGVLRAAGAIGFVTAAIAWYASFAGLVNGAWGRHLIPTFPDPGKRLARLGHGRPRVHSITSSAGEQEPDDERP